MNNDPYDNGIPKYSTSSGIYDGLREMTYTEEMSILSEMFTDVSYDGQEYYYTDKGLELLEKFQELSDYGNKMWIIDLAIWQMDQNEVHDIVWDALNNPDLAKRIGFKGMFITYMLYGDKTSYDEVCEEYFVELSDLNRLDFWGMIQAFGRIMRERGRESDPAQYRDFCHALCDKLRNLRLDKERCIVAECRALLTSYDDFMYGLRMNQALYQYQ